MYYSSFIAVHHTTVGGVIESAITGLTAEEQIEVVKGLAKHLVNQDVISPKVSLLRCLAFNTDSNHVPGPRIAQRAVDEEMRHQVFNSSIRFLIAVNYITLLMHGKARRKISHLV